MDELHILIMVFVAVILLLLSVFVLKRFDHKKIPDHIARSIVAIVVAAASISVVFFVYEQNVGNRERELASQQDQVRDQDRKSISQNFYKTMLFYSFAALRLSAVQLDCGMKPAMGSYSKEMCSEAARVAVRSADLLPSVEFIFGPSLKGSKSFSSAHRVATYLLDGEAALKARMPVLLDLNIARFMVTSRTITQINQSKFVEAINQVQSLSQDMGALYCLFSNTSSESWDVFDKSIEKLERSFTGKDSIEDRSTTIKNDAIGVKVGIFDCDQVLESVKKALPVAGGNGGGN